MDDELYNLEQKKKTFLAKKALYLDQIQNNERKRKLKAEIFAMEHPVQAKVGKAVINLFTPKPGQTVASSARKAKLKKKVATVSDVNKALDSLMRM